VRVTKYRKSILTGEVGLRLRDLVREICRTQEIAILQGSVSPDHVHVLPSCPPKISPSKVMQYIKGKTSRKLMMEFKHIQKQYWGRHLWARGYFVASSGNVTDEAIMEYTRHQDGTEPGMAAKTFKLQNRERRTSVRSSRLPSEPTGFQPVVIELFDGTRPTARTVRPADTALEAPPGRRERLFG